MGLGLVIMAGIAYNPKTVPADQAPKSWHDLLDPKWAGSISVKVANSGLQHETWYELKRLYGDDYWTQVRHPDAPRLRQLRAAIRSRGERPGQDPGHRPVFRLPAVQAKEAPIAFVYPEDGLPAGAGILRRRRQRAASGGGAAVHRLAAGCAGANRDRARPVPELRPHRRAAATRRGRHRRSEAAVPERLAGLPGQPPPVHPLLEQDDGMQ